MAAHHIMDFITGNAQDADTGGTGWFVGFSDWARSPLSQLLYVPKDQTLSGLCVKWFDHPPGHGSGNAKPVSEGRTISILVTEDSAFRIEFSPSPAFAPGETETVILRRRGDFAAWGEGLFHRWSCLARSTVLTIRWNPHSPQAPQSS